jgi:hypothetical protein
MLYSEDSLGRLHPIISRYFTENRRIPILKDKSIRLIKWQRAGLENLPGSPCIKRRIRERAIKDYRRGEHKKPPHSFNIAPTKSEEQSSLEDDDF